MFASTNFPHTNSSFLHIILFVSSTQCSTMCLLFYFCIIFRTIKLTFVIYLYPQWDPLVRLRYGKQSRRTSTSTTFRWTLTKISPECRGHCFTNKQVRSTKFAFEFSNTDVKGSPDIRLEQNRTSCGLPHEDFLVTARIRRMTEGNIFNLFTPGGRGGEGIPTIFQPMGGGSTYLPWMGEGVVPTFPGQGGYLPSSDKGEPTFLGWGVPTSLW